MMTTPPVAELMSQLRARLRELAEIYAPGGHMEGREYCAPNPRGGSGKTTNFKVNLTKGVFGAFNDSGRHAQGDAFSFLAYCHGGDTKAAYQAALDFLGIARGAKHAAIDDGERQRRAAAAERRAAQEKAEADAAAERRRRAAQALWLKARTLQAGDPAWQYLAGRGIDLGALPRVPGALRFGEISYFGLDGLYPAMVAAVAGPDGFHGIHRTYLEPHAGGWRKMSVGDPKKTLGPVNGGAVPLCRGATNRPFGRAYEHEEWIVAEGIEDGLSLAIAAPERRIVATLDVIKLKNWVPPAHCRKLLIFRDPDPPGSKAHAACAAALALHAAAGRIVRVAGDPDGLRDANKMLMEDDDGQEADDEPAGAPGGGAARGDAPGGAPAGAAGGAGGADGAAG